MKRFGTVRHWHNLRHLSSDRSCVARDAARGKFRVRKITLCLKNIGLSLTHSGELKLNDEVNRSLWDFEMLRARRSLQFALDLVIFSTFFPTLSRDSPFSRSFSISSGVFSRNKLAR